MSEHRAHIAWERGDKAFGYDEYSREHLITFAGGAKVSGSGALEYRGDASLPNPEEMLVAALSTCHMLTFLAICARRRLTVDRYEDDAVGHLAKNDEGRLAVTTCDLHPRITFATGIAVDAAELKRLHDQSDRGCFISASVKTKVTVHAA